MTGVGSVPFVVGQWVRGTRFYGRAAQIAEILDGPRNWIWLVGTRRLGKTSLLKQLEHLATTEPERGYVPIFWDLQGAENAGELQQALREALYDAEEQFDEVGVNLSDVLTDHAITTLSQTRRRLKTAGRRMLLLCDEAEELITIHRNDPALLRRLRRTLQAHDDVRVVLTSTILLEELADERGDTSPFLHGFAPPLYLSTLNDDDARALIRQTNLAPAARPSLSDDQVEAIRARCDNHPYLLQLVSKRFLERGSLEEAFRQVASDRMVSYFFAIDFEMLSPIEQSILRIVARQSAATSDTLRGTLPFDDSAVGAGLDRLAELAFIRRGPDRSFLLRNSFFRRWLEDWVKEHDEDAVVTQVGDQQLPPSSRVSDVLAARGKSPAAFDRRYIPPDYVAPRSPTDGVLPRRALPDRRNTGLGGTLDFHHGLLDTIDGRYELLAREGEGATGIVYRAHDTLLHTDIAIKVLRPEYRAHEAVLERFRQEIVLSRDIGYPNVLRTYHLGEDTHCKYLTMQWVDGQTLAQLIVDEAPLDEAAAVKIVAKLAAALEAAHARKVLHRDIKPQNIMVDRRREPYLMDFGVARVLGGPGLTSSGIFLGTPNYASPEQAALQTLDERSDLYALGVVLFELAVGRRPFLGDTSQDVLTQHRDAAPPDPRNLRPDLSAGLADIILRCLAKVAAQRYPSATALRQALQQLG